MNTKWWKAAGVRAIRTAAQTAAALIPAAVTITAVDWPAVAGTAALAAVLSLLTSLGGLPELEAQGMGPVPAACVRAVRTAAQTAVALIPAAATITAVDWYTVAGTAALAAAASLLMSVGGLPEIEMEG